MKDPLKLQSKLAGLLPKYSKLKLSSNLPWSEERFKEIAWVVKDYVNNSGDVTNDDPLHEWVEEYNFYLQEGLRK